MYSVRYYFRKELCEGRVALVNEQPHAAKGYSEPPQHESFKIINLPLKGSIAVLQFRLQPYQPVSVFPGKRNFF